MTHTLACCGLDCAGCPAYIATRQGDELGRERIAAQWSTKRFPLKPEDIVCDGCRASSGRLMTFCLSCQTRTCCLARGHKNCAHCRDYVCAHLQHHFEISKSPEMRATLDAVRAELDREGR